MNDNKLTDNEIVEAMKRCIAGDCEETGCPLYNEADTYAMCVTILLEKTLDLINRQKAEIERLKKELIEQQLKNNLLYETAKEIKAEAIREFAERLKEKSYIQKPYGIYGVVDVYVINHIVEEMTEVKK